MSAEVRRLGSVLTILVVLATPVGAAGPLLVNGAGTPLVWTLPVPFQPDLGPLGVLDNASAVARVTANFGVWVAVPTATLSFANTGSLPVDVTPANVATYVGVCGDGIHPIVFDTDGSITDALFGAGARDVVLGFAGPDCASFAAGLVTEGSAVLNGRFIDGVDTPSNPEISLTDFDQVFIHEFGHYVNLDHSQVGMTEAFDADPGNDDVIATMFPYAVNGAAQASLTLDDRVSVSTLYPAPGFATANGTITGQVLASDGSTPFQGAYVIARLVGDPRATAVAGASGGRYFPANPGGPPSPLLAGLFELPGLPPGSYTLEVEPVNPLFDGGSSVGPLDPPALVPGPAEFWNDAAEAGADPPDDPAAFVTIAIGAGTTQAGKDIVLNVAPPAPNDACAAPTVVGSLPFRDTIDTTIATTEVTDPLQSCSTAGAAVNSHSVWYQFTAPATGTLFVDTLGSSYDTVLTAYSGTCGALDEAGCNDDITPFFTLASHVELPVLIGWSQLFEVTQYAAAGPGGILHFALDFTPSDDTGLPPPDSTTGRCEGTVARALDKYMGGVIKCHTKGADKALAGIPFDVEACESAPGTTRGVQQRWEASLARVAAKCESTACYVSGAPTLRALAEDFLDQRNGDVYCAGSTPLGGNETGFVPPDVATGRCEGTIAKLLARFVSGVIKCHVRMGDRWARGIAYDDEPCEDGVRAKFDSALARIAAGCAGCAVTNAPGLRDAANAFLDARNGIMYCEP